MKTKHIATPEDVQRIESLRLSFGIDVPYAAAFLYVKPITWVSWIKGQSFMPLEFTILWTAKARGWKSSLPTRITPQIINDVLAAVALAKQYKRATVIQAAQDMGISEDAILAWCSQRRQPERARPWLEYYLLSSSGAMSRFMGDTP